LELERTANFPNCSGAVDGKHIRVIKREHGGSMFYNYKDFFSVVLIAMADTNYRVVYVDVGSYGKDCDSTIFKRSTIWTSIQTNMLEVPSEIALAGTEGPHVPFFFVGDEGFALNRNIRRPFGGSNRGVKKRVYKYRLCKARRYVECAFEILGNKWKIFWRSLNVSPDFAVDIVKACVVLHIFVRERDGYKFEEVMTVTGLEDVSDGQSARGCADKSLARPGRNQATAT